jgi:hypothetical protein
MSLEELRRIVEYAGLVPEEIGRINQTDMAVVERWLAGTEPVPDAVVAYLRRLDSGLRRTAEADAERARHEIDPECINIAAGLVFGSDAELRAWGEDLKGIPFRWFNAAQRRLAEALKRWGAHGCMVPFDRESYEAWLRQKGIGHSGGALSTWCALAAKERYEREFPVGTGGEGGEAGSERRMYSVLLLNRRPPAPTPTA